MTKTAEWYQGKAGRAEHLVYLNKEAKELEKLIHGDKTMIIRGGSWQKITLRGKSQNQRSCLFCGDRRRFDHHSSGHHCQCD